MGSFQTQYDALKSRYRASLDNAMKEQDRPTQCVHIKDALQTNKKLTELVQGFLAVSDPQTCALTPAKLQNLHADVQSYKDQHSEIQQGRDSLRSMENAYASLQDDINRTKGIGFWYLVLLVILAAVVVVLLVWSSIGSVFNTQSVATVLPGRFA